MSKHDLLPNTELSEIKARLKALKEDDPESWAFDGMKVEEEDGERWVYVPECSQLGDTLIMLSDTYEGSGSHCEYVQTACQKVPLLLDTIDNLWYQLVRLSFGIQQGGTDIEALASSILEEEDRRNAK